MIDIDHFKRINDSYGHQAGDMVLERVADVIQHCLRPTDFCFRYGGEEILAVLTSIEEDTLTHKAEHIRKSVSNEVHILGEGGSARVTVSIGAVCHDGHPDFQRCIERADAALYEAKRAGRNRVVSG